MLHGPRGALRIHLTAIIWESLTHKKILIEAWEKQDPQLADANFCMWVPSQLE